MDFPQEGFEELEKSQAEAAILFEPATPDSRRSTTPAALKTHTDIAGSDRVSPPSPIENVGYEPFEVAVTPPQRHELIRQNSGLPPTPPTMTNSDIAEPKPDRAASPAPLFADRVRNALESQRSGYSTPVIGNQSPPTPGTSPPAMSENIATPRPPLSHQPSSYADSFKTATEGWDSSRATSNADLRHDGTPNEVQQKWLENTMPFRLASFGLDKDEQSDSSHAKVRVKNYQMESDSDWEKSGSGMDDYSRPSPTLRQSLDHRATYQRLRKVIQPGDNLKRPDAALLYGSGISLKRSQGPPRQSKLSQTRDMTASPVERSVDIVRPEMVEVSNVASPGIEIPKETELKSKERVENSIEPPEPLPTEIPPQSPSPPTTAVKASLENNNIVYRMIQEENAKRHSAISDGSGVQAVVLPMPQQNRKLRHVQKHDSLRSDINIAGNSKRSISEGRQVLRQRSKRHSLDQDVSSVREEPMKTPPLVLRSDPAIVGQNHTKETPKSTRSPAIANTSAEQPFIKPPRLRRSLRQQSLDRAITPTKSSDAKSLSMGGSPLQQKTPSPKIRRFSREERLENNMEVRRTSLGRKSLILSEPLEVKLDKAAQDLTREGREIRDLQANKDQRTPSIYSATSPRRKSFDPRFLQPNGTPVSISQFSDRTAEVCVAQGVEIFPHNNDSLLLIQPGSELPKPSPRVITNLAEVEELCGTKEQEPTFKAVVDGPVECVNDIGRSKHTVDSPLTNPRAAPAPPVINFIPPTPNRELESPLEGAVPAINNPKKGLTRSQSLTRKVRRYSETLIQPLAFGRTGSLRKRTPRRAVTMPEERPSHLSSFWQPRDFWEDYESEDDGYYDEDDFEPLPPGGDTSSIPEQKRSILPRNMSVRMPGFRGTGGFLVGNSLGFDRHGTNKRRHHIEKRSSDEVLRRLADNRKKKARGFTLPFSGGTKVEYVGIAALAACLRERKRKKQELAAEKRRDILRAQIGLRLFHDIGRGIPLSSTVGRPEAANAPIARRNSL